MISIEEALHIHSVLIDKYDFVISIAKVKFKFDKILSWINQKLIHS